MQCACARILICDLLAPQYIIFFSRYKSNGKILGGGGEKIIVTVHKMCVLIFSTNLSEIFIILRRNERDVIDSVYWSSCKVPLIWSDFN